MKWIKRLAFWAGIAGIITLLEHGFHTLHKTKIPYTGSFMEEFLDLGGASVYGVMVHVFGHSLSGSMTLPQYLVFKWACFFLLMTFVMMVAYLIRHMIQQVTRGLKKDS